MDKNRVVGPTTARLIKLIAWLTACALALGVGTIAQAQPGTVTADDGLRIRDFPWGAITASLAGGTTVQINARANDEDGTPWYYVTTSWGGLGWVYADYVATAGASKARVGLQVGHWRYDEAEYPLNTEPGVEVAGVTERGTNMNIALALARRLSARGIAVDLLPATIPVGYQADAVVAIHADAGPSGVRGFFVDRPARSPVAAKEAALARAMIDSMADWTGIPYVARKTDGSSHYYGYRYVDAMTPMVLIETGVLTNAADRAIIGGRPDLVADALAGPIADFVLP